MNAWLGTLSRILPFMALLLCGPAAQAAGDASGEAALRQRIDAALEKADHARSSASPRIENLPQPQAAPRQIDVEALARRLESAAQPPELEAPSLLAFVSFSVPKASLRRLVADAENTGATLVLRGLADGSLMKTVERAQTLIGNRNVAWVIDPEAFQRFGIEAVPAYVLVRAGARPAGCRFGQCFSGSDFVRLTGDVPIGYALEKMAQEPAFAAQVRHIEVNGAKGRKE